MMNVNKLFSLTFWRLDRTYRDKLEYDKKLYSNWSGKSCLTRNDFRTAEWKYLILFRKAQANRGNFLESMIKGN